MHSKRSSKKDLFELVRGNFQLFFPLNYNIILLMKDLEVSWMINLFLSDRVEIRNHALNGKGLYAKDKIDRERKEEYE